MPEDKKATEDWLANEMPRLMGSGELKSNPILSREGGLQGINDGLDFVKAGKVTLSPFCVSRASTLRLVD